MDPKSELAAIQSQLRNIVTQSKASGRELTEAEMDSIELQSARATQLKAAIDKGIATADAMDVFVKSGGVTTTDGIATGDGATFNVNERGEKSGYFGAHAFKTAAQAVIGGRELKALVASGVTGTQVPLNPEPLKLGAEPLSLLTLLQVTQRSTPAYSYLRQTVRTNNAAIVADGANKPTSIYTVDEVDGHLDIWAHTSQAVPKYLLKDAPALQRFLESEMQNGVVSKYVASAITTLNTTSGIQSVSAKPEPLASIYSGIIAVTGLDFSADAIILNPADWEDLVTTRNAGGTFDVSGTVGATDIQPTLYGRPVILTSGQTAGTALVLDRSAAGISTDVFGLETEWNPYAGFQNNTVLARVEARFGTDVFQPAAIAKVDLAA